MDIVEIEQKETLSRKEVATRLRRLATMLAKSNDIKFEQGGMNDDGPRPRRGSAQGRA